MKNMLFMLFIAILIPVTDYALADIACPPMPAAVTNVNRDIKSDISANVAKLGPIKAGGVAAKTEVIAKNLFDRYPNIDKLITLQTMAATYCSMLAGSSIADSEKLDRWERFQKQVLDLKNRPPAPDGTKTSRSNSKPKNGPKSSLSPASASGQGQTITLHDLFKSEFPHLYKQSDTRILTTETQEHVSIESQTYLDFESQTIFIGYYLPNTSQTFSLCRQLTDDYKTVLELRRASPVEASKPGLQPVNSSELKFSGRVFIYHQYPLLEDQKRKLYSLYETKGLSLQFRDANYAGRFQSEQPLSISTNVTMSGADAKAEGGEISVAAKHISAPAPQSQQGDSIYAPNSVISVNQQGGITAHTVNVNNINKIVDNMQISLPLHSETTLEFIRPNVTKLFNVKWLFPNGKEAFFPTMEKGRKYILYYTNEDESEIYVPEAHRKVPQDNSEVCWIFTIKRSDEKSHEYPIRPGLKLLNNPDSCLIEMPLYTHPTKTTGALKRDEYDCKLVAEQSSAKWDPAVRLFKVAEEIDKCLQNKHGWARTYR